MKQLQRLVFVAAGITVVAMAASITGVQEVVAQGMKPLLVTITNTASDPVPVRDAASPVRQPFQVEVQFSSPEGGPDVAGELAIPPGKMFVIEYVSGRTTLDPEIRGVSLRIGSVFHEFTVTYTGDFEAPSFSHSTRLYVRGTGDDNDLTVFVRRQIAGRIEPGLSVSVALSGYLVDCSEDSGCSP